MSYRGSIFSPRIRGLTFQCPFNLSNRPDHGNGDFCWETLRGAGVTNLSLSLSLCLSLSFFFWFGSITWNMEKETLIFASGINLWGLSRRYPAMHSEKWRHLLKMQDTRNIVHRTMTPQSLSKQALWDPTQFSQSPSAAPLYFSWISSLVWNLFPFKVDFSFGKSLKLQGAKSGLWWGWVGRLPPHWLVQWRHHCSHILHSSPLSLAARLHGCHAHRSHILTMAELFPNRPHSILACQ